ncbi:HpcH/HpaI aldolase/citrate lyase family protein [Magnetospirillum sulfuroxidans]|uniref:CoA ester lyase n=1 Tax=Magnetospirillum sulfuroxidans TaxID=611300 RepID=A0ABS5I9L9_9PROT|nr:CoA ester lyase [Magnetospirillum sulfuroxidans]MBR9970966.1 CoA ester lyase [Magnetospirillum sulfuroxidans]
MIPPFTPRWRSLLFAPADNAKLLAKLHERGADAVILDLEDAIPCAGKAAARAGIAAWIERLNGYNIPVVVRINAGWLDLYADLNAVVRPGLTALMLPQVKDDLQVRAVDAILDAMEQQRGLARRGIGLIALIESPATLPHLPVIAALPRIIGLALGSEDFSLALRAPPSRASLTLPCQMIALAAAGQGLMALGLPDTLANFQHLDIYGASIAQAQAMGMTGALCIHPAQVALVNQAFAASPEQRQWAERVVTAWTEAEAVGSAVCSVDGQMVDRPVVERARALLTQPRG